MLNDKYYKINWLTVLKYCLYKLQINSLHIESQHFHQVKYEFIYKKRYIPMGIFFILAIIPYIFIGGIPIVIELFKELFLTEKTRTELAKPDFKVTKVFAYNRL